MPNKPNDRQKKDSSSNQNTANSKPMFMVDPKDKSKELLSTSVQKKLLAAKLIFDKFKPKLITDKTIPSKDLSTKMSDSEYVFVNFSSGTTQECDVLYSLVKHFGIKEIAITTLTAFEEFIKFIKGDCLTSRDAKSLENIKLANSSYDNNRINIRPISVEMIKTISNLLDDGSITKIHRIIPPKIDFRKKIYTDSEIIDGDGLFLTPYAGSINHQIANKILNIKSNAQILVFVPEIFDGGCYETEGNGAISDNLIPCSIYHYVTEGAKKVFGVNIEYHSGYGQNNGGIYFGKSEAAGGGMSWPDELDPYDDEYRLDFPEANSIEFC